MIFRFFTFSQDISSKNTVLKKAFSVTCAALLLSVTALSLQGCGKKGNPQAHCKAETFPPSYGQ